MTSLLIFIKKLLIGSKVIRETYTNIQNGELISVAFLFKKSRKITADPGG
jgi:hypothetical protein